MPILLLLPLLTTTALAQPQTSIFKDPRDNKTYRTVKIGEQVWMAENLNYEAEGSRCYENKAENCTKYGRLYNWNMAIKACPSGWHLPSHEEWDVLYKFVDSSYVVENLHSKKAGKYLKAKTGWNKGSNGEDKYGFAALPGGIGYSSYILSIGIFGVVGSFGNWWSATEYDADHAYFRYIHDEYAHWNGNDKSHARSVRCVRD